MINSLPYNQTKAPLLVHKHTLYIETVCYRLSHSHITKTTTSSLCVHAMPNVHSMTEQCHTELGLHALNELGTCIVRTKNMLEYSAKQIRVLV